jgi:triphosphoribosyl-dephospho-CoA synthase
MWRRKLFGWQRVSIILDNVIKLYTQFACAWEATARKPGNVHCFQGSEDSNYGDFLKAAAAISPVMERACQQRLGATVLEAVRATRSVVQVNVNLGIVLLLTPLAAVPLEQPLRRGVETVLDGLDVEDSRHVYQAIRLANPGGLGEVDREDVRREPTLPLRQIMALATDDLVARQYTNGFREVFEEGVPALVDGMQRIGGLEEAIVYCQLSLLAKHPDSLIARKIGARWAKEASERAANVLAGGWPEADGSRTALIDFDKWLRSKRNLLNPGTTADLVTASLFVVLREGILKLPSSIPWSAGFMG